jgi:hypothetical protein
MALERMRLIDMAHYWAKGTHATYCAKLSIIRNFSSNFGFQVLKPAPLPRPPAGPEIPLMWCQEAYGLRPGHSRRQDSQDDLTLVFPTVRSLRSAASQYFAWGLMVAHPNEAYLDDRKHIIKQACRPADGLGPTFHAGGISSRTGDDARPSVALLERHVRALDQELDGQYRVARRPRERRKVAIAGLANLTL